MTGGAQSNNGDGPEANMYGPASKGSGGAISGSHAKVSVIRRGTGPRTPKGKEKSKQNALKHGIFAKAVVLKGESQAEFDALLNGLREDFQPVGTLEEGLVEMLAVTRWRQRRLLIAEGAEVEAGRMFVAWDFLQKRREEAAGFPPVDRNGGLVAKISNREALLGSLELLTVLKTNIETHGFNDAAAEILKILYGTLDEAHWRVSLFRYYRAWSSAASDADVREPEGSPSSEGFKRYFLEQIDEEMKKLKSHLLEQTSIESHRLKLESVRRSVPDSPRVDQLLRYWTTLERTFDRTLSQLERAQRMRLGQPVPPRIDVRVSSE